MGHCSREAGFFTACRGSPSTPTPGACSFASTASSSSILLTEPGPSEGRSVVPESPAAAAAPEADSVAGIETTEAGVIAPDDEAVRTVAEDDDAEDEGRPMSFGLSSGLAGEFEPSLDGGQKRDATAFRRLMRRCTLTSATLLSVTRRSRFAGRAAKGSVSAYVTSATEAGLTPAVAAVAAVTAPESTLTLAVRAAPFSAGLAGPTAVGASALALDGGGGIDDGVLCDATLGHSPEMSILFRLECTKEGKP